MTAIMSEHDYQDYRIDTITELWTWVEKTRHAKPIKNAVIYLISLS